MARPFSARGRPEYGESNGVDLCRFSPDGPVADRSDDPLIVYVGRLCHQRAPDVAVAALALMRTPSVRLRLVGHGEDRAAVEALVTALGLDGRVEFSGFRPEPAPDLRAADVVLIPSRYDGMALILLEAMACGAAIVATRVPGTSALGAAGQRYRSRTRRAWRRRSMRCLPIRSGVGSSEPRPARGRSRIIRFRAPFREY